MTDRSGPREEDATLRLPPNMQTTEAPKAAITACPVLTIYPRVKAHVPRRLGFNVEIQTDADRLNLWDWLADSGATVIREFHPEVDMRRAQVRPGAWGVLATRADFDALRARFRADPKGRVDWANYRFDEVIPWLGVPNRIVERVNALGITPMVPMGYVPRQFPRPLVKDVEATEMPGDDGLDWEAAASAYEYYFAMIYHFASVHGCRIFMMVNEPEYRFSGFYLPSHIDAVRNQLFEKLFIQLDDVRMWHEYFRSLAVQCGALTRIARLAMDDARVALGAAPAAADLVLTGPVAGNLDAYWPFVGPYVDYCDYHQYSALPEAYRERFRRASALAGGAGGKPIVVSEFNRQAGEMRIANLYFPIEESLGLARILMELLDVSREGDAPIEAATLYHFFFPGTHRNYKSLVFGDMNRVDWTGRDSRSLYGAYPPSAEELQIRFATPAYHIFRMLARCVAANPAAGPAHPVFETTFMIRDTSRVPDMSAALRVLAVDQGRRLLVTVLNTDAARSDTLTLDLRSLPRSYAWAVVRETAQNRWDLVTAEVPLTDGCLRVHVAPLTVVQVILSDLDPRRIGAARLEERTFTPGTLETLAPLQTTRLRLIANVAGQPADLTEHNVIWVSDDPNLVRVDQGGLVQRVRSAPRPVGLRARLADGRLLAETVVPPDRKE
jgi:hypothetical protein